MLKKQFIGFPGKFNQIIIGIGAPTSGQKMIVKHIDNNAGVLSIPVPDTCLAVFNNWMVIRKFINLAVQPYALPDLLGKPFDLPALY